LACETVLLAVFGVGLSALGWLAEQLAGRPASTRHGCAGLHALSPRGASQIAATGMARNLGPNGRVCWPVYSSACVRKQ
jgi:hypothetical protein